MVALPDFFGALQRGVQAQQQIEAAPILQAQREAQLAQAQFNLQQAPILAQQQQQRFDVQQAALEQQARQNQSLVQSRFSLENAERIKAIPTIEGRRAALAALDDTALAAVGISREQANQLPLDSQGLDSFIAQQKQVVNSLDPQSGVGQAVVRSQILDDGATVQVLRSGETTVRDPSGNLVTGEERLLTLENARKAGIDLQGGRSEARRAGALAAELRDIPQRERTTFLSENRQQFVSDISETDRILEEIDRAIAIWEGAPGVISGPLASRLPSLRSTTQELESILTGLGIDRLSNFKGATSEKELATAFRAGASIDQNKTAGIRRLKAQRRSVERNRSRLTGLRNEADKLLVKEPQATTEVTAVQTPEGSAVQATETTQAPEATPPTQVLRFDAQGNLIP